MAQHANFTKALISSLAHSTFGWIPKKLLITSITSLALTVPPDPSDEIMHILIVILSFTLVLIASLAYLRRRNRRYLFLTLAFVFLFASQFVTMLEVAVYSNYLMIIPSIGLHLSHLFDLLMLLSFAAALMRDLPSQAGGGLKRNRI